MRCDMFPRVIQLNRIRHAYASMCRRFIFDAEATCHIRIISLGEKINVEGLSHHYPQMRRYLSKCIDLHRPGTMCMRRSVIKTVDRFGESREGLCKSKKGAGKGERYIWPCESGRNPAG